MLGFYGGEAGLLGPRRATSNLRFTTLVDGVFDN